jgi:23S rRNA pseudouridine1911/1915/1917 synthase
MQVEIGPELFGERVDKVVSVLLHCSRSQSREFLEKGMVKVADKMVAPSLRLQEGVSLKIDDACLDALAPLRPDPSVALEVRYEDQDVVVVDKPPGLVVHPGPGVRGPTLAAGLVSRYPEMAHIGEPGRAGLVHRLDKDTSGLLMAARSQQSLELLTEQLRHRKVQRRYLALVEGQPVPSGTVDAPLGRLPRRPDRVSVVLDGRPAVTRYHVIGVLDGPRGPRSLIEASLETGRTHQIRVHMASIGHPVVGDQTYGSPVAGMRHFLHAWCLEFFQPSTQEPIVMYSPLPRDLAKLLPPELLPPEPIPCPGANSSSP